MDPRPISLGRRPVAVATALAVLLVVLSARAADRRMAAPGTPGLLPAPASVVDLKDPVVDLKDPGAAPAAASAPSPVRVLSADARGVEFEYLPGEPEERSGSNPLGPTTFLEFDGASPLFEPGRPVVPVRTERILLPPGADYRLRFTVGGEREFAGLRFPVDPPPPVYRNSREDPGMIPPAEWPAPIDRLQSDPVVQAAVEEFRGRRLLLVTMAPAQYNAARGTARVFEWIRVRVDFLGGASAAPGLSDGGGFTGRAPEAGTGVTVPDPALESVWQSLVLNPAGAAAARFPSGHGGAAGRGQALESAGPRPLPAGAGRADGIPADYFDDASHWVRISVRQNGLYRVTGQNLLDAGVSLDGIDPATIRLFWGSGQQLSEDALESQVPGWGESRGFREAAIQVVQQGTPDDRFDASESVLFYGLAVDNFRSWYDPTLPREWVENDQTDTAVCWLTWGGTFSGSTGGLRMDEVDATPEAGAAEITSVREDLHAEVNTASLYDATLYEAGIRWEKWWWRQLSSENADYPDLFNVNLPDADVTRPGTMFARWWGANIPAAGSSDYNGLSHHLTVTVNDSTLPTETWLGMWRRDMRVSSFRPRSGINRITAFTARIGTNPNRKDLVNLAWFEFSYWKILNLARNAVWFQGDSAGVGPAQFRAVGATEGAAVYDVTDAHRPSRLLGAVAGEGSARTLGFRVADQARRRFLLVNPAGILSPAAVRVDSKPSRWLRDTANAADYIVIAYDDYLAAAEDLAEYRRGHLRGITERDVTSSGPTRQTRVTVVKVSDIYDEFSGGMVDVAAIRNFLQYAFNNWGGGDPGLPPPAYVCLIGDANRDTRDRTSTGVRNAVPTWSNAKGSYEGEFSPYSTDDFLGRLGGPSDLAIDLIIGRLPVASAEQAREVVQKKIIGSERFSGVNPHRNRSVFVADDVCQVGSCDPLATAHIAYSEAVARVVPAALDEAKVYLYDYGGGDCAYQYKPSAKQKLLTAMNEGAWLVNYMGHGGSGQLADEKVLESSDVSTLDNLDNLPLLVAASCNVGEFDHPASEGLAEVFVKSASGGCQGVIAATHYSWSGENAALDAQFIRRLFPATDNRSIPAGRALFQAKLDRLAVGGDSGDHLKAYNYLGDPASTLVAPNRRVRFLAPPDTLFRGGTVTVTGEVLGADSLRDASFSGTLDLEVLDHPVTRRAYGACTTDIVGQPYVIAGATIFSGRAAVTAGRFTATFVVPVSLRGGPQGRIRAYAAGVGGEAVGVVDPIPIGGEAGGVPDTVAPRIVVTLPSGRAAPGEPLEAVIADSSGVNLTGIFDFRSLLLTLLDSSGQEQYRADVTGEFSYDEGSHTRGRVHTTLPDVALGRYKVVVTATDNFNNRGEGSLEVNFGTTASRPGITRLYGLPNPVRDGETMQISFTLDQAGTVRVSLYSVSGRKVREWSLDGVSGENRLAWDGTDARGDPVANGVYLVRVVARNAVGRTSDLVEPVVRAR